MSPASPATLPPAVRLLTWTASLTVAAAAIYATAHGQYQVAVTAGQPRQVAYVYPLITDGLALIAYALTRTLTRGARRYAWTVTVGAAGLSGLAQAVHLAGGVNTPPALLRFGVGYWPAIAAVTAAHLVYLHATSRQPTAASVSTPATVGTPATRQPPPSGAATDVDREAARLHEQGMSWAALAKHQQTSVATVRRRAKRGAHARLTAV